MRLAKLVVVREGLDEDFPRPGASCGVGIFLANSPPPKARRDT